ncbi:unnamed protein product [Lupinus luteus]|uniref:Glutaredoxin domain-containing protein n=1 Tax=Lupinus luteus TaxID=3873 RepID=A0AAV1W2T4_LUPLU
MALFGNNNTNNNSMSSSSTTMMSRFPFLSRSSTTVYSSTQKPLQKQSLEREGSMSKFYADSVKSIRGKLVKKLCNLFEPKPAEPVLNSKLKSSRSINSSDDESLSNKLKSTKLQGLLDSSCDQIRLPGTGDRIVLYFTSLRGIRRTYEDCYAVRMIFKGFRVLVDERDISMDAAYRKELMNVLGEKNKKTVTLPQVFIRGKYFGGADVIKYLCEVGELGKILEGLPRTKPGFVCESCGDVRFVPCGNCSGSRKLFDEDEGLMKRCFECNENGIIRCPNCCF